MDEFRNFQFVAPDGLKDVTAAFRQYYAVLEGYERTAPGTGRCGWSRWTGSGGRRRAAATRSRTG